MSIINLHKRCNKKSRKVSQPKKVSESPKSDKPKKASGSDEVRNVSGLTDDPGEEEQKPKKSDGKKTTTKAGQRS